MAHAGESPVLPRLSPAVDHVLDAFGPERLMFASDWPVMNETTDYKAWVDIAEKLLAEQSDATRGAIFGENARCFYGI